MRIPSAYLPAHARRPTQTSLQVSYPPGGQNQVQAVVDSYDKNARQASAQVIDAEFVDCSPPSTTSFNKERHTLDYVLGLDELSEEALQKSASPLRQVAEKYQVGAKSAPQPSGSQLDVFA